MVNINNKKMRFTAPYSPLSSSPSSSSSALEGLALSCYPAFRGLLLLLADDSSSSPCSPCSPSSHSSSGWSILALASVCKLLTTLISNDTHLFQLLINCTYHLAITSSFLENRTRQIPFRNLSCSTVAKHLHHSLSSFNPSHLTHLKSTRLSLPSSFKKSSPPPLPLPLPLPPPQPRLLAFFMKSHSKLVFVSLLQQCSVVVFNCNKIDFNKGRKLQHDEVQHELFLPFFPAHAVGVDDDIWLLDGGATSVTIFHTRATTKTTNATASSSSSSTSASWSSRIIKGSGPKGLSVSCLVFLPEQKMLACVVQVKSGFYLYFLDTQTCEWVKLIKCTDMEAKLLPNPQLLCDGSSLFVLLTSAAGNLHFLCVDCAHWQLSLAPICGPCPCENARELVSLSMYFPWKGTLMAYGIRQEPSKSTLGHGRAVRVYMLRHDPAANHWAWSPHHANLPSISMESGPVKTSFINSSQLFICTDTNLHMLDLFLPSLSPSPSPPSRLRPLPPPRNNFKSNKRRRLC